MTPTRQTQLRACEAVPRPGDVWRIDPVTYTIHSEKFGLTRLDCASTEFRLGQWTAFVEAGENYGCFVQHGSDEPWNLVHQPAARGRPWPTWIMDRGRSGGAVVSCPPGGLQALVVAVSTTRLQPNVIALCVVRVASQPMCVWLPWSDLSTTWTLITRMKRV